MPGTFCLYVNALDGREKQRVDLDLSAADQIAVTRQLNDVTNILKPGSNFGKNLILLGTPQTLDVLGYRHRADLDAKGLDQLVGATYTAHLEYDGLNLLEGEATLEINSISTDHQTGLPSFDCFITGTRYQWATGLSEMRVHDLYDVWPTHTKNDATVKASWDKSLYPQGVNGVVYYPFYYGAWRRHTELSFHDLHGHLYVMYMLHLAFEKLGYKIIGDWATWKETLGLTIPHTRETIEPNSDAEAEASMTMGPTFEPFVYEDGDGLYLTNPLTDVNFLAQDQPPHWNTPEQGDFKVPYHGAYSIQLDISGTNTVGGGSYFEVEVSSKLKGIIHTQVLPGGPGGASAWFAPFDHFQAGDVISFRLRNAGTADPANRYSVNGTGSGLTINLSADYTDLPSSHLVNGAMNLPEDVTVGEILEGVAHIYGLFAVTDGIRKTVELVPSLLYYKRQYGENITHLYDASQPIKELPALDECKNIFFKYKNGNDKLTQGIEAEIGKPLYGEKEPLDPSVCREVETNPTFYPTWYRSRFLSFVNFVAPAAQSKDEPYDPTLGHALYDYLDEDIGLRILYYDGEVVVNQTPPTGYTYVPTQVPYNPEDGGPLETLGEPIPYAYMADTWRALGQNIEQNEAFGTGLSVYLGYDSGRVWSTQYPTYLAAEYMEGSAEIWYKTLLTIRRLFRRFKVPVKLTVAEYLKMDFSTLKYLDTPLLGRGAYLLNKITDFIPKTGDAFLELLQFQEFKDTTCPSLLSDIGMSFTLIETPTDILGFTVEIGDIEKVRADSYQVFFGSYYLDQDPTPLMLAASFPGSGVNPGYHWDVFPFDGVFISPIAKVNSPQRHIRFVGVFSFQYKDGRRCTLAYCWNLLYDDTGTLVQSRIQEICADAIGPPPELNESCCFSNFVEIDDNDGNPSALPNAVNANRTYTLTEFTINGVNVVPGAINQVSPSIGTAANTVDFLECTGYGLSTCSPSPDDGLTANNFQNLVDFINGLTQDHVRLNISTKYRCIEYTRGVPFTLEIVRTIGGTTTYRLEYDGTNPVQYWIGATNYTLGYSQGCFDLSEMSVQAITVVSKVDEDQVEVDFTQSIATDGDVAANRGTHTYTMAAYRIDNGAYIDASEIMVANVNPGDTIPGAVAADWAARWGVASVSGTYGTFVLTYEQLDPGVVLPDDEEVLVEVHITFHSFTENLQSDAEVDDVIVPGPSNWDI